MIRRCFKLKSVGETRVKPVVGLVALVSLFSYVMVASGCASRILKYKDHELLKENKEFEQVVKIETPEVMAAAAVNANKEASKDNEKSGNKTAAATLAKTGKKSKATKKEKTKSKPGAAESLSKAETKTETKTITRRQPEIESDIGFSGRRPIKDPFLVGEKVTHRVHYFKVSAGTLSFEVKPFVYVNGRKSYNFRTSVATSSFFSSVYTADDFSETLVDYENLVPSVFTLHVQESGQLKEAKSFFDFAQKKALYWETKVTEKNGKEEKKQEWELEEYSQNVFSAAYYMRNFQWVVGEENVFRVADDGENINFRGKAIRKETLETEVGPFEAIVIKPEFELKGVFKPVGDIYIWLSNDDRKFILKIESKIKIGTLVSEIIELVPGQP